MKPWEETWKAHWDSDYSVNLRTTEGRTVGTFGAGGPEGVARAELAAAAPDMARVLLAVEWAGRSSQGGDDGMCPACDRWKERGHMPDCALDAALRKAGVR